MTWYLIKMAACILRNQWVQVPPIQSDESFMFLRTVQNLNYSLKKSPIRMASQFQRMDCVSTYQNSPKIEYLLFRPKMHHHHLKLRLFSDSTKEESVPMVKRLMTKGICISH